MPLERDPAELEALIKPVGFYSNEAKSLLGMSKSLVENFNGQVSRKPLGYYRDHSGLIYVSRVCTLS